jgi:hypothetical protein
MRSQSPYGAKWFATSTTCTAATIQGRTGRNPLTGLSGLQLYPLKNAVLDGTARGGFVRKMKFGICMGRITGVFGGLCR